MQTKTATRLLLSFSKPQVNKSVKSTHSRKLATERFVHIVLFLCAFVSVLTSLGIVAIIGAEAFSFFSEVSLIDFLTDSQWTPLFYEKRFGIRPLLIGTLLTSSIALLVAVPAGLIIAIYLSEFASERFRKISKPVLEVLAGIPTVVYGYFALLFMTPLLQRFIPDLMGFNALSPGIVMGVMILPMVASLSEDAIYSVPRSLREGAYALGAGKLQVIFGVVLPAAFGGIAAACILAMSRAIGETMIVAIAAGQQPSTSLNPLKGVETMTAYIVQVSLGDTPHGTIAYKSLFAVGGTLFVLTFLLNSISMWVRSQFRGGYEG